MIATYSNMFRNNPESTTSDQHPSGAIAFSRWDKIAVRETAAVREDAAKHSMRSNEVIDGDRW